MKDLVGQIRGFLLRQPKPAKLRVTSATDETYELDVRGKYAALAESAAALSPTQLEAYDREGKLLRAMTIQDVSSEPTATALGPAAVVLPEQLKESPEAALLALYATLLAKAYHHSSEVAFDRFLRLIELQNERQQTVEERLERVEATYRDEVQDRIREAWREVERASRQTDATGGELTGVSPLEQLALTFMQAKEAGRQQAAASAQAKNGQSKTRKAEP